ncbi:MAG: hypothetical protein A3J66_00545 [Candidatus Magasanikbacteria bacterium RIFCSPHIGHO2_02_FULL_47_14]|uniref:DUF218 domain-containing protein n=1 Tax=Candidatus Magasanikbacteria bacterium RIFCSPHIGHO2_02_FULL_47_14 TaxID=1798680 RepID=A0A1F6M9Z7_9BACT|nr:MAG: hypothetical protein A3J66_00545 [Candidatus Magasanikbacteria bacterium RIFCSPHIGHO2_02_FULL_47_14]
MVSFVRVVKRVVVVGGGVFLLLIVWANVIIFNNKSQIVEDIGNAPTTTVALVFGGGMKEDGNMSDMQTDRVEKGIELYQTGKVQRLVMTGDDGARRFDEVHAMRQFALDHSVPDQAISIDPHGYNTYSSCYRAKNEYQFDKVIAISQEFHLPRIIYFCEHFGVETTGLSADKTKYGFLGSLWGMHVREILARTKGWWQVEVTQPPPLYFTSTSTSLL